MRTTLALLVLAVLACKPDAPDKSTPPVTPTSGTGEKRLRLSPEDMAVYLAVKRKALSRLEEALDRLQASGGDPVRELGELTSAEREAARALGVDPSRYARIEAEVARVVAARGREEEIARLEQELKRNLEELERHTKNAQDPATRQFLEAQARSLQSELAELASERKQLGEEQEQLELLARFRVEMAQLQARQDRLARRIREAVAPSQRARTGP